MRSMMLDDWLKVLGNVAGREAGQDCCKGSKRQKSVSPRRCCASLFGQVQVVAAMVTRRLLPWLEAFL